jgi:leader peptidase (prepilin peptidase)/N-methyltransferase
MLRGRARCCGALIPFKFFLAELLSAIFLPLLFLAAGRNITVTAVHAVLLCTLLVASFIDIDTLEIPDCLSVGLATVGMLTSAILPEIHGEVNVLGGVLRSACGLLGGTGILFWIAVLGEQIFKKEAIGLGDVKLVGAIGTFCGVGGALWAIFGGAIAGTIVAIPLLIRKYSHGADTSVIAFVPFLSVGTLLFIFFGGAAWL